MMHVLLFLSTAFLLTLAAIGYVCLSAWLMICEDARHTETMVMVRNEEVRP